MNNVTTKPKRFFSPEARLRIVEGNRNRVFTEATREKMSKAKLGHVAWNKGQVGVFSGEKSPHWKGGITKRGKYTLITDEYRNWRTCVLKRDKFKCKISDKKCSGSLQVHHILPWRDYPELHYEINNGITLCKTHHPRKREDEAKLSPYFQSLIIKQNNG